MAIETAIPTHKFKVDIVRDNRGFDSLQIEGKSENIPVYSVRNPDHHELIAQAAASGEPVAFFAVGLFGILLAVDHPRITKNPQAWRKFWHIKRGRELKDKVPIMVPPKHLSRIFDVSKLHPDFRYLKDQEAWTAFYGPLPLHVIGPVKESAAYIHPAFITTPEDSRQKPPDQYVRVATVCAYSQNDPDWLHVGYRAHKYAPYANFGVTSFNEHGLPPPFNFMEMVDVISDSGGVYISAITRDELAEKENIRSSNTQIRLPLWYEKPELIVVRKGAVSPEWIERQTGHPVRVLKSAKVASRGYDESLNLDPLVEDYIESVQAHLRQRKKRN